MQSILQHLKAIFSQRDPPKEALQDKRVTDWLEKRKKHINPTAKETEDLIKKYQLKPKGKPVRYALMELPPLIKGFIPGTIFIMIINAQDFEQIAKGENIQYIDMLLPDKRIFAETKSRIFSFKLGYIRIYTDTNFNASTYYRMLWNALNHTYKDFQGKVVKIEDFLKSTKNNFGLYYDVIFDRKLIILSTDENAPEPKKHVTLIYQKKQADS